jgi:hypothetical protein
VATALSVEAKLARQAREVFLTETAKLLAQTATAVQSRFGQLVDEPTTARESQDRRDAFLAFKDAKQPWVQGTVDGWKKAFAGTAAAAEPKAAAGKSDSLSFSLMGDDVMEDKIVASRMALRILDKVNWELNDLRLRIQRLEGTSELAGTDILKPEVVSQYIVEQWRRAGMSPESWRMVQDILNARLADHMVECYHAANELLVNAGVMVEIDLRPLVKRVADGSGAAGARESGRTPLAPTPHYDSQPVAPPPMAPDQPRRGWGIGRAEGASNGAVGGGGGGGTGFGAAAHGAGSGSQGAGQAGGGFSGGGPGSAGDRPGRFSGVAGAGGSSGGGGGNAGDGYGGRGGGGSGAGAANAGGSGGSGGAAAAAARSAGAVGQAGSRGNYQTQYEETRMQTAITPLARARARAQGVLGQLKRMIVGQVADFDISRPSQPSPQLTQVIQNVQARKAVPGYEMTQVLVMDGTEDTGTAGPISSTARVEQAQTAVRQRTQALKKAASTQAEKATIEIVALMFQSILAEERIPAGVRVWFARLQMPVLRLALAEPEFFESLQHPARQLIDHMGSCVLGFDANVQSGKALELEIKRIVQVIEQYPETGRRAFQLVYEEFQKFLAKFLTEKSVTKKVVSVAQQVEQKETLAIQYTIELRNTLKDMPVPEPIRDFLYKVWAEVLAICAMRFGPQHEDTLAYKKLAVELVWAAGAKPNRAERAKVIADLPPMLQRLRKGMALLGMELIEQDQRIKVISDTLAEAFMSKTDAIDAKRIDALGKRLANLEDYLEDVSVDDMVIDQEMIEFMDIDVADLIVIGAGGTEPTEGMRQWAAELQPGSWFTLDHNSNVMQVQYVWRSDKGQLHVFSSTHGKNYLIQAKRLAAYLQAGLLAPVEDEALTVRATRNALTKLDANPERLLESA